MRLWDDWKGECKNACALVSCLALLTRCRRVVKSRQILGVRVVRAFPLCLVTIESQGCLCKSKMGLVMNCDRMA